MKSIKFKLKTIQGVAIQSRGYEGMSFTLQAVYYSSTDPSKTLQILDKDGDPVSFPFPGSIDPKLITVDPVTADLPLTIIDESSGNDILLRGTIDKAKI